MLDWKNITGFIVLFLLTINNPVFTQDIKKEDKSLYKEAINAFADEDFLKARNRFSLLVEKYPDNFEVNYYLGACFLNTTYQKTEAIPFLKKAVEQGEENIPSIVHKDLGDLYHDSYDFDKALHHYKIYLSEVDQDDEFYAHCSRMIEVCQFAQDLIRDTLHLTIRNINEPVNTENSEFAPYVSTDDSILFFSRRMFYSEEELELIDNPDTVSRLFVSYKTNNKWSMPQLVSISGVDTEQGVSLAGMSPDGEYIYLNALRDDQQDIFVGRYHDDNKLSVEPLPAPINSPYWEGKVTISPDGNTIWFASDRPESIGGKDIFKSEKLPDGSWGTVKNMGEPINTVYDENAPFIHPSGSIFYFSSTGHNTMGGYDIFSVFLGDSDVLMPENLGFPINTTGDDTYFTLSANGKVGYFSSSYGNKYKNYDIYQVEMNLNIPLTLVKGTIMAGAPPQPIAARIRVFDNQTGVKLKYVYNPNPKTGRYLMIFPPGKNYDMIVEAENYETKSINIYVPNQATFYELFQNLYFEDVINFGQKVGEKMKVENLFFENHKDSVQPKDYGPLFDLIDAIIEGTDELDQDSIENKRTPLSIDNEENKEAVYENLFNMVDEAFEMGDTSILNAIHEETVIPDRYEQIYFFPQNKDKSHLEVKVLGKDTIFTTPTLLAFGNRPVVEQIQNDLISGAKNKPDQTMPDSLPVKKLMPKPEKIEVTPKMLHDSKPEERKYIITRKIFFDLNQVVPNKSYSEELDELASLLVNNRNLGFVITGYTDTEGTPEQNKILAKKRALNMLEILKGMGVNPHKAIIVSNGETKVSVEKTEDERANNRRVEVQIFELILTNGHN